MLEVAVRKWINCGNEGMHMISNNTQIGLVALKLLLTDINEAKVCQENIPTPVRHRNQLELFDTRHVGCLDKIFWPYHMRASAEIPIHQTMTTVSRSLTVQSWWACANFSMSFLHGLGWQKWSPTWSSASVVHPPEGLTCCAFSGAFLLTTIVQSGLSCLSYSSRSASSNVI